MFYKYTIIFFNYQIFFKTFFNPIARVSFITYKVLHLLINVIYERFFKLPNYFVKVSGFVCIHTFGFINVGFNFNICCVGWNRTTDLQVMSLTSYRCYYHAILNTIYESFFKLPNIFFNFFFVEMTGVEPVSKNGMNKPHSQA